MRVKMSNQPSQAPTTSEVGPCPTVIQIVGRPGTGSLPSIIAPPNHPLLLRSAATDYTHIYTVNSIQTGKCLGHKSAQKIV